jgi:hypothetical protein
MQDLNDKKFPKNDSEYIKIVQLNSSFDAFGAVMNFLSEIPPFKSFELSILSQVIRTQLHYGQHLAAINGETIIGYAGWLRTTSLEAASWVEGRSILTARFDANADAAALTVFAVTQPTVTRRLIRGARTLNPGAKVYFKRGPESAARRTRKATVFNFSSNHEIRSK